MKQLSLLMNSSQQLDQEPFWRLFIDGSSRNNPGPAGAGVHLMHNAQSILKEGFYVGIKTNNQAEYLALLLGLFFVEHMVPPHASLMIISDSELLVRQFQGRYRVKNPELQVLYTCALHFLSDRIYTMKHVLRHDNKVADKLANEGIDKRIPVPQEFYTFCSLPYKL